jgi:hypothetical protein
VELVVRLLLFLLGTLSTGRPSRREAAWYRAQDAYPPSEPGFPPPAGNGRSGSAAASGRAGPSAPGGVRTGGAPVPGGGGAQRGYRGPRRRRIAPWVKWAAPAVVLGVIFRRAIAALVLIALSAALHLVGINVHLPRIPFAWPWQTITGGTTTNTDLGPWVLQKIEGISRPALGQANFSFVFTHRISKNIGPWPCWYASTFSAVGHASATVNLNPGPGWWAPALQHYRLQTLSTPGAGKPGHVTVTMVLPRPQLPRSAHDVTIDNIPSQPIDTQHSWTYPGLGCGVVLKPQFAESVLYAQAQRIAFYKARHAPLVAGPLVRAAETQATVMIRDNFIQPTVNALGYTLDRLTVRWAPGP